VASGVRGGKGGKGGGVVIAGAEEEFRRVCVCVLNTKLFKFPSSSSE